MSIIYTSDISDQISFLKIQIEVKIPDWTKELKETSNHKILQ